MKTEATPFPADGNLEEVALHMLQCGQSWEPDARIVGNCRAVDIASIAEKFLILIRASQVSSEPERKRERL